ncbi:MAG: hypothetical protein WD097_00440 [Balneolales bacterium]
MSSFVLLALLFLYVGCSPLMGSSSPVPDNSEGKQTNEDALSPDPDIFFPDGFAIVVNQVGYMQGHSLEHIDGPWRAGIRRHFTVNDYKPMAEVGKAVGIRFMSLFVLAEMDRLNVVATLPHARQEGTDFDNHENIGPEQLEIMGYVKKNAANIELGVAGVGHEWWDDGVKTRSEWYNLADNEPRSEEMVRRHMDVIRNILWQYGISEDQGHSFPESFSAYGYYWNPGADYSTGRLFSDYGGKYVSTRFGHIPELNPPPEMSGGFDNGVYAYDRGIYGNVWHRYADPPSEPVETFVADQLDSHWANWLATDDWLQPEVNEMWIEFFRRVQAYPYRYLAKNTEQFYSQMLYKKHTTVNLNNGRAEIDNRSMPDDPYQYDLLGNMVLSIPLQDGQHVSQALIDGNAVAAYFEEAGYGYIYLPKLDQDVYTVTWEIGNEPIPNSVNNSGTYNVYDSRPGSNVSRYEIKMYGTQDVRFRVSDDYTATSEHEGLTILNQEYDSSARELVVTIQGQDIIGETGVIRLDRN